MSKESNFLIYCMERYRHFKGLSGSEVAKTFEQYGLYEYITKYFESLHTIGDLCIVQDIDDYIRSVEDVDDRLDKVARNNEYLGMIDEGIAQLKAGKWSTSPDFVRSLEEPGR